MAAVNSLFWGSDLKNRREAFSKLSSLLESYKGFGKSFSAAHQAIEKYLRNTDQESPSNFSYLIKDIAESTGFLKNNFDEFLLLLSFGPTLCDVKFRYPWIGVNEVRFYPTNASIMDMTVDDIIGEAEGKKCAQLKAMVGHMQ